MGEIRAKADSVYRDNSLAGVVSSGRWEPTKGDIRELFRVVDVAVYAAQAGIPQAADIAARDAFFAVAANQGKLVYVNNNNGAADDPANGVYEYVGGGPRLALGFYQGVASVVQPLVVQATAEADRGEAAANVAVATAEALPEAGALLSVAADDVIDIYVTKDRRRSLASFDKAKGTFRFAGLQGEAELIDIVADVLRSVNVNDLYSLFSRGEGGLLIDPADFSTLFQDAGGTIPVTAFGQPVALALDKSGNGNDVTFDYVTVEIDSEGGAYFAFNGASSEGHLPAGLLAGASGATIAVAAQFDSVANNNFLVFFSTAASEGSTRLGLGISTSSPNLQSFARRLDSDSVANLTIDAVEPGAKAVYAVTIDHTANAMTGYVDNIEAAELSPLKGVGTWPDAASMRASIGRGPNLVLFTGRIYGLVVRVPVMRASERVIEQKVLSSRFTSDTPPPAPEPPPAEINVYLVVGQSNADGRVPKADGPAWIQDGLIDGVKVWNGSGLANYNLALVGPNGNGSSIIQANSVNKFSFAHFALKEIAATVPNVVAMQLTSGGTAIAPVSNVRGSWCADYELIPEGTPRLTEMLIERFAALQAWCVANAVTLNVRGLIWHQGESDSLHAGAPEAYLDRFTDVVAAIRTAVGDANLPIFYGTVPATSLWYSDVVRTAHLDFAAGDANAYCRDNDGLTFLSDGLHFNAASSQTFGEWVATQALALVE